MVFQNPLFLWALFFLSIPIIIHLFNFRKYKNVKFSNVGMLLSIETESKKSKTLKKWLVLLSRLLTLFFVILAFSKPYIPTNQKIARNPLTTIYIDNSMSMNAEGKDGQLFQKAKDIARSIINESGQTTSFQIIDNVVQPLSLRTINKENALQVIDELDISGEVPNFQQISNQVSQLVAESGFDLANVFLIADFQKQELQEKIIWDSIVNLYFISLQPEKRNNLSIDSAWISEPIMQPDMPIEISVRVHNRGRETVESATINLEVNGLQQGSESFSLAGNEKKELFFNLSPIEGKPTSGHFQLNDFPIVFDDTYYFSFEKKSTRSILYIADQPSDPMQRVFDKDNNFNYKWVKSGSIDYQSLQNYDCIILDGLANIASGFSSELHNYLNSGGSLMMIPPIIGSDENVFLNEIGFPPLRQIYTPSISLTTEDLKGDFYKNVYKKIPENLSLPKVTKLYGPIKSVVGFKNLLTLKDGAIILAQKGVGKGNVFVSTLPLDKSWSSLIDKELFVVTMLKIAFDNNLEEEISYFLNRTDPIKLQYQTNNNIDVITLKNNKLHHLIQLSKAGGSQKFWLNSEINTPGIFTLQEKGNGQNFLGQIALNYPRSESVMDFWDEKDLKGLFDANQMIFNQDNISKLISSLPANILGKSLWHIFIVFALLFTLIEVLLLRFLK